MKLSEYSDEELIQEIIHRGLELKVHISGVEIDVTLGGIAFGDTICTEAGK